ncbi:uncharacterized protein RHOBADRAFT_53157 [Rhodotorula graminis WP1]|uniref:Uncharacterized protein n=1 Tax=Rhodotorula graminis (strain WP1) TaxID=578459 RepID=A0A194S3G6_RHOGW|nr:uncharacterized protein RHOBADRAFT_53157 [Rhodotorula graminis WP1]KPV75132.1 hypothetical protein RHOBADRAFT_53157 [Rhodotorula graminis WP1]
MSDTSHLSPPHTPVSSVCSSFLSFSPDAPRTPRTPLSSAIGSPGGDVTPKASRDDPLGELALDAPPARGTFRLEPPPASRRRTKQAAEPLSRELAQQEPSTSVVTSGVGSFSSRNPFAALIGADPHTSTKSTSSSSSSGVYHYAALSAAASSASGSSRSASRSPKVDDLAAIDELLLGYASRGPSSSSAASSALDTSLEALGLDSQTDMSSAWQDELYSSLSESSPVEAAFPPRIPRLSFQAPSPEQLRCGTGGGSPGSPRRARKTAMSSPRHPFGRSATASSSASPTYSPRRSPRRTSPRKVSPRDSPTRPRALVYTSSTRTSPSLTSPAIEAFQLAPTSPVQPPRSSHKLLPFALPLSSLSSSFTRHRSSPPKPSGLDKSARSTAADRDSAAYRARRAAKDAAWAERDRAAAARAGRAVDGINVEELDRFFGVTPRRGKAIRGGYVDVALEEGVVGASGGRRRGGEGEEQAWRRAEEFRGLLDDDAERDAQLARDGRRTSFGDVGNVSSDDECSGFDVRTRRGPPPPLFTSSTFSTSSSSRARSHSYASSSFSLDDAASALDAHISLASPIDLSCTSLPSLLPSISPSPFSPMYPSASPSASPSPYGSFDSSSSWASSQASFGPRSSSLPVKG